MGRCARRWQRVAVGLLTGLLVGAGLVATSAPASADATVFGVVTPASGGIDVHLYDPSALWVQVTVLASTAPDAAVLYQSDDLPNYDDARGWHTDTPIQLADGADYGDYPVTVDYRLPGGTVQHWTSDPVAPFQYVKHVAVTSASFDRAFTDYDHRSTTLSGALSVFDPKAGTTAPAASTSVRIQWVNQSGPPNGSTTAQTSADGSFSTPVTPGGAMLYATVQASQLPSDSVADAAVTITGPDAVPARLRLTGGPAHVRVHAGASFTVSGTIQRLTSSGWQAIGGAGVQTVSQETQHVLASGTSSATGHFSYSVRVTRSVSFATEPKPSPYVEGSGVTGQAMVPTAGQFVSLSFAIDAYQEVTARGHLWGTCPLEPVQLQYSKNGRTSWLKIATARATWTTNPTRCTFKIQTGGAVDGYYRVVHPETDQMLTVSSSAHRLTRIRTRFVSFAITPTSTYANGPLTATGRLQQLTKGAWHGYGHAHVVLVFRPKGDTQWYWVVKGYTDSTGRFTLHGNAYATGAWGVYYAPDSVHYYSQTPSRTVKVG